MENSRKLLFKWMMMEPQDWRRQCCLIWYPMGRRSNVNLSQSDYLQSPIRTLIASLRFRQKMSSKPNLWLLLCRQRASAWPCFGACLIGVLPWQRLNLILNENWYPKIYTAKRRACFGQRNRADNCILQIIQSSVLHALNVHAVLSEIAPLYLFCLEIHRFSLFFCPKAC